MAEVKSDASTLSDEYSKLSLNELFDVCLKLKDNVEDTNYASASQEFQDVVQKGIKILEEVTQIANANSMFSMNETLEDVATNDIKFLLLPALSGYFHTKIQFTTPEDRLGILTTSEEYYNNFLNMCNSYEVPDVKRYQSETDEGKEKQRTNRDIQSVTKRREEAVKRYKLMQELDKELDELKPYIKTCDDDETKRKYYVLLIQRWSSTVHEELRSIGLEKCCVRVRMAALSPNGEEPNKKEQLPPFKPMILVRNELQKKVLGAGYPSLPLMTVDEFYQQRYPETEDEPSPSALASLQQMAADPEAVARQREAEDVEEEQKLEQDDPQTLAKERWFDDWKDENRRGSGNRYNKG